MRIFVVAFLLMGLFGCDKKKTDTELFDEGKIQVALNASPSRGYEPLNVSFEAYLENRERVLTKEILEAKWIITGPNGFHREIVHEALNMQDAEGNQDDSFYLDFVFNVRGRYTTKLVLNKGEYISNPYVIYVIERETEQTYRSRY